MTRAVMLIGCFLALTAGADAQTVVSRPAYTLVVGANGLPSSLKIHGQELFGKPLILCPGVTWTLEKLDRPAPNDLRATLKSKRGGAEIDYRLEDRRVVLSLKHHLGGFQSWEMTLGDAVLGVENLQNTRVDGAEGIQYTDRGDLRPTPLAGLPRTQRVRLYLADGSTVLFWHDGWGAPFNLDEIGGFRGMTYRRNLLNNNQQMRLYFALDRAATGRPPLPAPAYVPAGDSFANLFYFGEPLRFTLRFTDATVARLGEAAKWRLSWTVTDFSAKPVTSGSCVIDGAEARASKVAKAVFAVHAHGWFSVLFTLAPMGGAAAPVLPSEYRTRFAVVDRSPAFPDLPARGAQISDYGYAALLGLRCLRESHNMHDFFPAQGKADWARLDQVIDGAAREAKRWDVNWFFQANGKPDWCTPKDYEAIAYAMVSRYKDRCHAWEVENEPNFHLSPADYVQKVFVPFATGARRADPTCDILGPACVSVPATLPFVEEMKRTGALRLATGISTHTYVGPGEPWELYGNPEYLAGLRKVAGSLPIWQTEQGYTWDNTSRQQQARYVVRQYLNAYAAGIPDAHQYYFYPVHHGFEPWYLVEMGTGDALSGTLEPAAVALRVMHEQTAGLQVGRLDRPVFGVYMLRFAGADHDLLAVWTLDFPLDLTLRGRILGATDFMGNPVALRSRGGETTVKATGYALYLRVPKGARLEVVGPTLGTNRCAAAGVVATASSASKDHPAADAIDGRWAMRDPIPGLATRTYWEAGKAGAPQWIEVEFPAPRTIDRAVLVCPLPAVDGGVPRDFTVQVPDADGHWRTVASVKGFTGWVNLQTFPPVKTRRARLLITALNDGWHLDGRWEFMVREDFTRYTSMQCRVLDWELLGPGAPPAR